MNRLDDFKITTQKNFLLHKICNLINMENSRNIQFFSRPNN